MSPNAVQRKWVGNNSIVMNVKIVQIIANMAIKPPSNPSTANALFLLMMSIKLHTTAIINTSNDKPAMIFELILNMDNYI